MILFLFLQLARHLPSITTWVTLVGMYLGIYKDSCRVVRVLTAHRNMGSRKNIYNVPYDSTGSKNLPTASLRPCLELCPQLR